MGRCDVCERTKASLQYLPCLIHRACRSCAGKIACLESASKGCSICECQFEDEEEDELLLRHENVSRLRMESPYTFGRSPIPRNTPVQRSIQSPADPGMDGRMSPCPPPSDRSDTPGEDMPVGPRSFRTKKMQEKFNTISYESFQTRSANDFGLKRPIEKGKFLKKAGPYVPSPPRHREMLLSSRGSDDLDSVGSSLGRMSQADITDMGLPVQASGSRPDQTQSPLQSPRLMRPSPTHLKTESLPSYIKPLDGDKLPPLPQADSPTKKQCHLPPKDLATIGIDVDTDLDKENPAAQYLFDKPTPPTKKADPPKAKSLSRGMAGPVSSTTGSNQRSRFNLTTNKELTKQVKYWPFLIERMGWNYILLAPWSCSRTMIEVFAHW